MPTARWKAWSPKGAARVDGGRPRRYRPEPPAALIARISNDHGQALERLSRELDAASVPDTETLVEIDLQPGAAPADHPRRRPRRRVGRPARPARRLSAARSGAAPPVLRGSAAEPGRHRPGGARLRAGRGGRRRTTTPGRACRSSWWWTTGARSSPARNGSDVRGHWSTAAAFVAAARLALERFRSP